MGLIKGKNWWIFYGGFFFFWCGGWFMNFKMYVGFDRMVEIGEFSWSVVGKEIKLKLK